MHPFSAYHDAVTRAYGHGLTDEYFLYKEVIACDVSANAGFRVA